MSEKVLDLDEFNSLDQIDGSSISRKDVLSISDLEQISSTEEAIQSSQPSARFALEQNVFATMVKGSKEFFNNIGESFEIGNESSNIDMMGYSALAGEFDYIKDVKPIREKFDQKIKESPIEGGNFVSDAIYAVSGMLPAMGKGIIEGKTVGMAAAVGALAYGQLGPQVAAPEEIFTVPAALAAGTTVGSMNYWYKQGAGSLYGDLKDEGLDDGIAAPIAHIAGSMYGAVEFLQVDKLMPGSKEVTKKLIVNSVKKTVANLTMKYGTNWITEVGEEGLQEVIMSVAKDVGTNIAQKTNSSIGGITEKALVAGWGAAKKSAVPMLLLLSPSAAIDTKRIIDDQKTIQQAQDIINQSEAEQATAQEVPVDLEAESAKAVEDALGMEAEPEEELPVPDEAFQEDAPVDEEPTPTGDGSVITTNAADAPGDAIESMPQESQPDLQRISETDEYQNKAQRVSELQGIIDTFNAKKEASEDVGNIKIRKFKGGYLKEELSSIPKKFFTSDPNAQALDELADSWNVSMDEAIEILKANTITKKDISEASSAKQELSLIESEMRQKNPHIGEAVDSITQKSPKLKLTQSQIIKRIYQAKFKGERQGLREGRKIGREQVMNAKKILDRRRSLVSGLAGMLSLSDSNMKRVNKRDIRLMSNFEFKEFIDKLEALATTLFDKREVKNRIAFEIGEKRLKVVDNLRRALKLPTIDNMTLSQLRQFEEAMSGYEAEDEFLSVRKLETVKNTELAGIATVREAREVLAKKLGVPIESVSNIKVSQLDKFRFDAALADQNPFYKLLVDETNMSMMAAEQQFLEMEKEVDDLVNKARNSRKQTLADKIAPTDALVFKWLETKEGEKPEVSKQMTEAEIDLAVYLRERFAQFRDYLIKSEVLKKFKLDYITHIRRGFLETWKQDGVIEAFKEVFNKYKEDAEAFQILEGDTQNILPLEKFFQYSMKRSGNLKPSENVAKAFKKYSKTLFKKQALDKIIPALDIYAYSLSPKEMTPRGLQMNRQLIQFTREFLNNKKGRKSSLGGLIPQGGAVDMGLRVIDGFITLIDLGLNIPVGVTVSIGEQVVTFTNLGSKKYTQGIARMNSIQGKEISKKYESFVGKSPWRELVNTADSLGDKFHKALFLLFETSNVRANKIHLLGSLSKEEFESGEIDRTRLAELKREIGRFRAVSGAKSIFGSTSAGSALTKYKSWAIPIFRTAYNDFIKLGNMLSNGEVRDLVKTREFHEVFRGAITTSLLALAGKALIDDDDDSFIGELLRKARRESLSLIGALDPTVFTPVRLASFLADLSSAIKMIITLEEYVDKPGYKGVEKLKKTLTPKAVNSLTKSSTTGRIG